DIYTFLKKELQFKGRIVHGMLTASLWSTLVGTRLPGPGCAYMSQEMKFLKPVHVGETVTARITVAEIEPEKQRVYLDGECRVNEELVAHGRGVVWVPKREEKSPAIDMLTSAA
ncbi:MAG: MaoC family dehydratase, partial [Deltaproteobacteria bacterium]|nr:MaoC family dehydratase [Deltaproteobacteria bacterium]